MLEHVMTAIVRKRVYVAGVLERVGALNSLVVSGFEPQLPAWQVSALSIVIFPLSFSRTLSFKESASEICLHCNRVNNGVGK